ncbi:MAG: class I tRNA ligase family protein, partial [Verrucomicrobia bacterium]|nr:class I tRNA ligase family protein [Verrucomicrobiota bacterium]
MDYKNTLNLPRTDFAMKADLVAREPQRLERWQREDIYARIQAARKGAPKFVLHDGPPFANGDVHIGTALNKILKDIIVKYKTLRGFDAPYVPGWDCHGLPIEFKVSQEMRKRQKESGVSSGIPSPESSAAEIRTACEAYARKFIDLQRTQFKRLGVFGDWENPYLTLNKEYEADELRLFADLVEKGFVYRGKKPVYWSIPCRTALAEAEVEYQDHVSQSVYVKFKLKGEPNTFLLIWTTTPWTLPANLAVAFSSKFYYSLVHTNGESYLVCNSLLDQVTAKCGWPGYEIIRTVHADELAHIEYEHPFCARTGKAFAGDEFVDNTTGTGFVHIAPGHGMEDYNLGRRVGLPIYSPVNDDGCFAHTNDLPVEQQMPAEMLGKSILEKHGKSDANEAVLHELRVRNTLAHQENYHHSYPHCWRSKTPIIFRAMDQWFIKIDHAGDDVRSLTSTAEGGVRNAESSEPLTRPSGTLSPSEGERDGVRGASTFRQLALDEINRVHWIPDWGKSRIEAA